MAGFFKDDQGNLSSMRVMALLVVVVGLSAFVGIVAVWAVISLRTSTVQPLSFSEMSGVVMSFGALMAKAAQKGFEVRAECRPGLPHENAPGVAPGYTPGDAEGAA